MSNTTYVDDARRNELFAHGSSLTLGACENSIEGTIGDCISGMGCVSYPSPWKKVSPGA